MTFLHSLEVVAMAIDSTPLISLESLEEWSNVAIAPIFEQNTVYNTSKPSVRLDALVSLLPFISDVKKKELELIMQTFYTTGCDCAMHGLNRSVSPLWFRCLTMIIDHPHHYEDIIDQFSDHLKSVIRKALDEV